jgi:hypothetical protein
MQEIGRRKYWSVREQADLKKLISALRQPGARIVREISRPLDMMVIELRHRQLNPSAPPLSDRQLARLLGRSDKTIRAWKERIEAAGPPPPTLRADGSVSVRGEDLDDWMVYLSGIEDPRFLRRIERRRQQESD